MKYPPHIWYIVALVCMLGACGPRDVGEGTSSEHYNPEAREPSSSTADNARYPMDGKRVNQRLYLLNQPAEQGRMQDRQRQHMDRRMGITRGPDDSAVPRQRNPFRE
ncbi:MAG: chemotaxis protein [Desulfovibrionaceae bacterium]